MKAQTRKNSRKPNSEVPSFLRKLYEMLEAPNESIMWNNDGTSFIVKHVNEFSETMLPKFFKHKNFTSFVRQLNMYGFYKIRHENQEHEFQHKLFKRNAKHLLPQIKRKVTETQEEDDDSPAYSQKVYCTHGSDLQKLRRDISSSNKEVETLRNKVLELEKLNEHLLKQNTSLLCDSQQLIKEVAENSNKSELNLQKMFYAVFSMVNNGSLSVPNRKGFPNFSGDILRLENNSEMTSEILSSESPAQSEEVTESSMDGI